MRSFTDGQGRKWELEVNGWTLKQVAARAGVSLSGLFADELRPMAELLGDPVKVVDTLWVLCEKQAKGREVSEEDFARMLAGDAYEAASDALVQAAIDFMPRAEARDAARDLMAKSRESASELTKAVREELAAFDPVKAVGEMRERTKAKAGGDS